MDELDIAWCKTLIGMLTASYDENESGHDAAKAILSSEDFKRAVISKNSKFKVDPNKIEFKVKDQHANRDDDSPIWGLIVNGVESAKKESRNLKLWMKNANSILIIDPYVLHFPGNSKLFPTEESYCDYISDLVSDSTKDLIFVGCSFTSSIKSKIKLSLKNGRSVHFIDTNQIHDRYIIKDYQHGKMLGTSLGGFGNKLFTILDLPTEDVKTICNFIHEIKQK